MIYLRRLREADLPLRVKWMNNKAVYSSMSFIPPISMQNTIAWFQGHQNNNQRFDCTFINERGDLLAMAGLTSIDYTSQKAELYIFVNPDLQRKGIGRKATYLLCKYAFHILNLTKVYLFTNNTNVGAQKTYEKVGFVLKNIANNNYADRLYYELTSNDMDYTWMPLLISEDSYLITTDIQYRGVNIKVVRDDIFPFIGGGSKARKAMAYETFLRSNGYNAVVTCGGIQSNHNRAMALMCARNGWECHLCIQGTKDRFMSEKGNALLNRLSGAECEFINPEETSEAMDRAMNRLQIKGYNPYYVIGGGHNLPGGTCFVDAIKELKKQCEKINYKPDYIFLASGTGSTQAGIVVGLDLVDWSDVKCVGISVARKYERGKSVIVEFANMLANHYGLENDYSDKILFNDNYLCGGYEKYTPEIEQQLTDAMAHTGMIFDTTYSGKGFYGMMQEINKHNLHNKNIIFWHTGGIMNIMK